MVAVWDHGAACAAGSVLVKEQFYRSAILFTVWVLNAPGLSKLRTFIAIELNW
jgi:hypothetical protein